MNAAIETIIVPRTRDLGGGFEVRPVLPSGERRTVGPFVFLIRWAQPYYRPAQVSMCAPTRISASPL